MVVFRLALITMIALVLAGCGAAPQATAPTAGAAATAIATQPVVTIAPTARPTDAPTDMPAPTVVPTEVPTVVPTEAPTPESTVTPLPEPPQSGGLGLSREQWEARHGTGVKNPVMGLDYEGGTYSVLYQDDPSGADTVWILEQRFGRQGVPIEDARSVSKLFIPLDGAFVETYRPTEDRLVDLYLSTWLKGRFPESMKIGTGELSMWPDGKPGNFTVFYQIEDGQVTSIFYNIGNSP